MLENLDHFGQPDDTNQLLERINEKMFAIYARCSVLFPLYGIPQTILTEELHFGVPMGLMLALYFNEAKEKKVNKRWSVVGAAISFFGCILYAVIK